MKSKHCAHSVPAESKRRTNFDLRGLAGYILAEETVGPLRGKPRVGLLPSFLVYVPTLPNFRLRVSY